MIIWAWAFYIDFVLVVSFQWTLTRFLSQTVRFVDCCYKIWIGRVESSCFVKMNLKIQKIYFLNWIVDIDYTVNRSVLYRYGHRKPTCIVPLRTIWHTTAVFGEERSEGNWSPKVRPDRENAFTIFIYTDHVYTIQ